MPRPAKKKQKRSGIGGRTKRRSQHSVKPTSRNANGRGGKKRQHESESEDEDVSAVPLGDGVSFPGMIEETSTAASATLTWRGILV